MVKRLASNQNLAVRIRYAAPNNASVAQSVERQSEELSVVGSIPTTCTK